MKSVLSAAVCTLALAALFPASAFANPQHERMKRCNAEARTQELKGDERRSFMSSCLKGRHDKAAASAAAPAPASDPAAQPVPAGAGSAPASAAPQARQGGGEDETAALTVADSKEKRRQCNRAATEQALSGAARKAFVSECMAG